MSTAIRLVKGAVRSAAPPVTNLVVTTEFSDIDYGTLQTSSKCLKFEAHAVKESAIDIRSRKNHYPRQGLLAQQLQKLRTSAARVYVT
jgi:hypothetical protein